MKRQDKYQNTKTFNFYNANPWKRITADCVVRAISAAMGQSYELTYKELFELSLKTGYMLNDKKCYEKYLSNKGWLKMPQPKKEDNTKLTGKEFCEVAQEFTFNYPSRMIAHVGGHHLVAIINGKIWDTWDCTPWCIGNYWVCP